MFIFFSGNERGECGVVAGSPDQSVEDCVIGDVINAACDGFMYEECDYYGEDPDGVSAPPGQITNPTECEEYCQLFASFGQCSYWVFNSTDLTCNLLNSAERTCWGLTGPKNPSFDDCITCTEEEQQFVAVDTVYLQPYENMTADDFDGRCDRPIQWNLTGGANETEIWRLDNSCGSIALSENFYQDVEFTGSFESTGTDDDWLGFVFGYQDPGHFYIVLTAGSSLNFTHGDNNTWRLVKVESETSTSSFDMTAAILSGLDVENQTKVLHRVEDQFGWKAGVVYTWSVVHQPTLNSLTVQVFEADDLLWEVSWDKDFPGSQQVGKLGVWTLSQSARFFDSSVKSKCSLKSTRESGTLIEQFQQLLSNQSEKVLNTIRTLLDF